MPDLITDAIATLRLEASGYTLAVQVWMKIMAASFFSGLIIAWWDRRALWIGAMAALTVLLLILAKIIYPDVTRATAGAVIHLVLWPLCVLGVWRSGPVRYSVFRWWRIWVSVIIAVSLVLDVGGLLGEP